MKRYTEDVMQEMKEALEATLEAALDAKQLAEAVRAELHALRETLPVPNNVTPITKKSSAADSSQAVESKEAKAASDTSASAPAELPEDTDELREQVRNLVAHLMREGHRDNAKAMVRRVAGDRKLPQIEDHGTLVKLHKLLADFARENDLPTGAQA